MGDSQLEAYDRAYATDPTSAFGGIIAFNRPLDAATAKAIVDRQFVEVIIAPGVSADALRDPGGQAECAGAGLRPVARPATRRRLGFQARHRRIAGARPRRRPHRPRRSAHRHANARRREQEIADLLFAWKAVKFVKSNAIVYCKNGQTIGIGAGQMSRVYSARIAAIKAADEGLEVKGSVLASDAFFPFRDGLDSAAEAGITAVIQPGGSVRDAEVIAAADEHGMAMVFTGMRHFRH